MIRLALLALMIAAPAMAQQTTLQQQVDGAAAEATAVITNMRGSIMQLAVQNQQLQAQVADLTKQVADLTKERDALKAANPAN